MRVHEPVVDVPRLLESAEDRVTSDLVEHHPAHGNLRSKLLHEVPGNRLALAVFVRREQQFVRVLELLLEVRDDPLLPRVDDVVRLEAVLDCNAERAVFRTFVGGDLARLLR